MKFKRPYRKIVYRKKVNILLVGIVNRNLGDAVIADNAAYLVRRACPRSLWRHCNLQLYDIAGGDCQRVAESDLILFAGGGIIKFRQEQFYPHVAAILDCAEKNGIPVYFNCVGVEGYDGEDERCQILKAALNLNCVKAVTVRDDAELLRQCYVTRPDLEVAPAVDAAIFTPEVYGIKRDRQSDTVGLGIARWRIFEDYGIPEVDRQFQLDLWKGIIGELERRGYKWKLFVNGLRSDYDFALEVLEYAGYGAQDGAQEHMAPRPAFSYELVETIASFQAVIACRMHANIIAYALQIPSIGLVWNDKMIFWGQRIGYEERFLTKESFQPQLIADRMEQAIRGGVRAVSPGLRRMVIQPLARFLRKNVRKAYERHKGGTVEKLFPWQNRLVATALGGINQQYQNMNTPQGLEQSVRQGFLLFEADVRLTTDGKLVCVNGWSGGTYEKLGMNPDEHDSRGLDYGTFCSARMYDGHFGTMDFGQLLEYLGERESLGWKLVLDIGKPDHGTLGAMIGAFSRQCGKNQWQKRLFLRVQSRYDVEQVKAAGLPVTLMYYIPPKEKREEKQLTLDAIGKYCKKQQIEWVSMPKETLDGEVAAFAKKAKLKMCVFSLNTYTEICQAVSLGTDWIATSYFSPRQMRDAYEQKTILVIR